MRRVLPIAAAFLLGGCAAPPRPATSTPDVRIERSDASFDLDRGITRVAVDNPWGEINVRSRDEREVGLHAVIQRLPPRYAKAAFRTHREGDTLRIEVVFDGAADDARPGRADLAVYLPADLALALRARDGRIAAKKRTGAVEALTESGQIIASTQGRLDLQTRSGQIRAAAFGARWSGASRIVSDSGRLIVLVPTFGDVALDARTGGRLDTNFGLSVQHDGSGSRAQARYGRGSSALDVNSRSGEIVLAQLVLMSEDAADLEDDD